MKIRLTRANPAYWVMAGWLYVRAWWILHKMPPEQRRKAKAMAQLLGNLITPEAMEKIAAGSGESWSLSPTRERGAKSALGEYVAAVEAEKPDPPPPAPEAEKQ